MSVGNDKFIVVGIDGSQASREAAWWAMKDARSTGIEVRLVAVVDESQLERADARLEELADELSTHAPEAVFTTLATTGDPAEVLVDLAADATLLVLGEHGKDEAEPGRLGTVAAGIPGHALCSVLILRQTPGQKAESEVPDGHPRDRKPVVVGLDTSVYSAIATIDAAIYARVLGVPLRVLTVIREDEPGDLVATQVEFDLAWLRAEVPGAVIVHEYVPAAGRTPAEVLVEAGDEASGLAVGKRGMGLFESMRVQLGRTSAAVLRDARSSVLFVPYREDRRLETRREVR
nr:universal stress protein [Brevibacterium sp. 91QC2O2]